MENSIFAVKRKTKFDLPVAIVTSVDAVLVLIAAVLLSLTFFRLISPENQVEIERNTSLKKDEKTAVSCDTKKKDTSFETTFAPYSAGQSL